MIAALRLLLLGGGPLADTLRLGLLAAGLLFAGWLWIEGERREAREGAVIDIEREHARRDRDADAAERRVMDCPPGRWNRGEQRCE